MSLRFPPVEDVPLTNAPLTDVVCQVRFPSILKIGESRPAEFQEAIRQRFPEVAEEHNVLLQIHSVGGAQSASAEVPRRVFQFRSADGAKVVSLDTDAYALSTSSYTTWDDFANDLALVHRSALAVYGMPYAKRIGLRYINQFDANRTGCSSFEELKELLRPELVGLLTTSGWDQPEEMVSQILLQDNGSRLVLRVAARTIEEQPPIIVLDLDYYEEGRIPMEDLVERCAQFHDVIYRAFRWALGSNSLHLFKPVGA